MTHTDVTPLRKTITLTSGEQFVLEELTLLEYGDLEDHFDCSIAELTQDGRKLNDLRGLGFMLWLFVRRNGRSPNQCAKRSWAMTFEDLQLRIRIADLKIISDEVAPFFREVLGRIQPEPSSTQPDASASGTGT